MKLLLNNKKALLVAVAVGLYFRFLLTPTAWLFYELYHLTGIDFVYWGYSGFRAGGYYFGIWPYQGAACVLIALLVFAWRAWRDNKHNAMESSQ